MKIRLDCSTELGEDAAQRLRWFLDGAEAGELDGDEMLSTLGKVMELVDAQARLVRRSLGQ